MALKRIPMPVAVTLAEEGRRIEITWDDGRRDEYRAFDLRVACPCAGCVDELSGVRTLDPDQVDPGIAAVSQAPVGRYALQIEWSDGHRTGMYSYEGLRGGRFVP